jgi:hypothetical protein
MDKSRRSLFAAGTGLALSGILQGCGGGASAGTVVTPIAAAPPSYVPPPYPQVVDMSGATAEVVSFFRSFFTAKSLHKVDETMAHFSPDLVSYMDATLGLDNVGFAALQGVFARSMPKWPQAGLSYPTRILGDMNGALVAFTDTPELFGGEIRALGTVDFKDGKIVRWLDHWDARGWPNTLGYPKKMLEDFRESQVADNASVTIRRTSNALQQALMLGDAAGAAVFFTSDAVYEDMALRLQIQGRDAIRRFLARALPTLPNGVGTSYRHSVGSAQAGGYEWQGRAASSVKRGVTALVLDQAGFISRSTTVYDSTLLSSVQFQDLARLSFD